MKKFWVYIISLLTLSCFLYSQSEEALDVLNLSKSKVVQIKVKGKKKEDLRVTNGFLIEEGKFVVANLHSLSSGASIVAETGDGGKVESSGGLIISKSSDLALILVRKKGFDFFNLANYSTVGPGEKIYIICIKDVKNPRILEGNIVTIFNLPSDLTIYRLSISCQKIFDGAPVINSAGEVVGILNTIGEEDSSIAVSLNSLSSILSRQQINFTGEDFLSSSDLKLFHSVLLIHSQKFDRAFQILNELSTIETTNPFIQYYFGIISEARNQKDEALKSFQKAIQLKTDFPEAYLKIGSIYEKSGEFEKAVESYKNALKVKAFPEVYYSLALLYEKIDKKD
ncbi:MAG: tetratricopeptide repeat protein, partial [Candidatus Aminicenantia bacterium]